MRKGGLKLANIIMGYYSHKTKGQTDKRKTDREKDSSREALSVMRLFTQL